MFFGTAIVFKFNENFQESVDSLEAKLAKLKARPCGDLEREVAGWTSPLDVPEAPLVHAVNGAWLLALRKESKILPGCVVKDAVKEAIEEIRQTQDRTVSRKEKADIKDRVTQELLQQAFVRSSVAYAYIDTIKGWLVVNASTVKKAEDFVSLLRKTLGTLPVSLIYAGGTAVSSTLTDWVTVDNGVDVPEDFLIQDECELVDSEGGVIRCKGQDLASEDIQNHIHNGMVVSKLALNYQDRLSFVLDGGLTVKRLKFLDAVLEELGQQDIENAADQFAADFALMSGELREFIARLDALFLGDVSGE